MRATLNQATELTMKNAFDAHFRPAPAKKFRGKAQSRNTSRISFWALRGWRVIGTIASQAN
jgi:hypothetical protein